MRCWRGLPKNSRVSRISIEILRTLAPDPGWGARVRQARTFKFARFKTVAARELLPMFRLAQNDVFEARKKFANSIFRK